jgi:hypothetical protein
MRFIYHGMLRVVVNVPATSRQTTCCFSTWQSATTHQQLGDKWDWPSGVHILTSMISRSDSPWFFPVGICKRWLLNSANAYNSEQLEASNTNSDCKSDQPLL